MGEVNCYDSVAELAATDDAGLASRVRVQVNF